MLVHVMLALSIVTAPPSLRHDPSLAGPAICGADTMPPRHVLGASDEAKIVLLDDEGVLLTWDTGSSSFELALDGAPMGDLVTAADERRWPSFEGAWSDGTPGVFGAVDNPAALTWLVDLARPGEKPTRYTVMSGALLRRDDVTNSLPAPLVIERKKCDCSDGAGLSCKFIDCVNQYSCSAGTATCRFETRAG